MLCTCVQGSLVFTLGLHGFSPFLIRHKSISDNACEQLFDFWFCLGYYLKMLASNVIAVLLNTD